MTLFGALNALKGKAISACMNTSANGFLKLLRKIDRGTPATSDLRLIADNYSFAGVGGNPDVDKN